MKTHRLGPTLPSRATVGLSGGDTESLVGGDPRASTPPGLLSLYSLFLNEHNRTAANLRTVNTSIEEEVLYMRTRNILIAELQNIIFKEFLLAVLGSDWMSNLTLPANLTEDTSYNSAIDPGIYNEFATVAFRFGHVLMPNSLKVSNLPMRTEDTNCPIKDNYFKRRDFRIMF